MTLGDDPALRPHPRRSASLSKVRTLLAAYAQGHGGGFRCSVLLYCCATYTWLLVGVGMYLAAPGATLAAAVPRSCRRCSRLGVCMLSPVNDYFRYFLPIVAMAFPLTGFALRPKEN